MKKILFTINFLTNGGPTRVLQNIINNLDRGKFDIYILTLINENDFEIVSNYKEQNIKVIELNYNKQLSKIIKEKKKITDLINEINPDIIHTHGIVSTLICASKNIKAKKVTTIHNSMFEDYQYTYGNIKGIIFSWVHIFLLKKYAMTICCSKTSYNVLKNKVKKISYIRNGIDITTAKNPKETRNRIRKELNLNENDIVYIYVGVINDRKKVVELVDLFSRNNNPKEHLLIIGDGPLLNEARKYSNSNTLFLGFKTNCIDYLYASDVYISNSSSEGFSISIIEALSAGLLCLLSDIPSHKECFEIDNNVYIGEYFNKLNFEEKKQKIFLNAKNYDSTNIIKFQKKYLSAAAMTNQYLKIYKDVGDE